MPRRSGRSNYVCERYWLIRRNPIAVYQVAFDAAEYGGLDAMLQKAPKNWDQLNLEVVVAANVIEGHRGPPTVVAVETR
jgi:hypothetical protein